MQVSEIPQTMTVTVNGGDPVRVVEWTWNAPPVEYVRSESAVMPDPAWSHVDSNGHEHLWSRTDRGANTAPDALPTLVRSTEHVACDGSCDDWDCEGYDVIVWHCGTCGEKVEPGYVPDYEARGTGIPIQTGFASAELVVEDEVALRDDAWPPPQLDLVIRRGDQQATALGGVSYVGHGIDGRQFRLWASFTSDWTSA